MYSKFKFKIQIFLIYVCTLTSKKHIKIEIGTCFDIIHPSHIYKIAEKKRIAESHAHGFSSYYQLYSFIL